MPNKPESDPLSALEKTQEQLRENIEESKQLVERAQALIRQARDEA